MSVSNVLSDAELQEIVEGVWMTVLQLPVELMSSADLKTVECMTATVRISGAWHGYIHLRTTAEFLTRAAAQVFLKESANVDVQDRVDMLTELTNMIGGTVKCLLPEVCDLSLPALFRGQFSAQEQAETDRAWVHFTSGSSPLAIAIVEKPAGVIAAA